MLPLIKSTFILNKIFSCVDVKIKLNLARFNKTLQNRLNVDMIDFRRLSKRYIKGERNGFAKEYNSYSNELIFEGGYLVEKEMEKEKNIIPMVN